MKHPYLVWPGPITVGQVTLDGPRAILKPDIHLCVQNHFCRPGNQAKNLPLRRHQALEQAQPILGTRGAGDSQRYGRCLLPSLPRILFVKRADQTSVNALKATITHHQQVISSSSRVRQITNNCLR